MSHGGGNTFIYNYVICIYKFVCSLSWALSPMNFKLILVHFHGGKGEVVGWRRGEERLDWYTRYINGCIYLIHWGIVLKPLNHMIFVEREHLKMFNVLIILGIIPCNVYCVMCVSMKNIDTGVRKDPSHRDGKIKKTFKLLHSIY